MAAQHLENIGAPELVTTFVLARRLLQVRSVIHVSNFFRLSTDLKLKQYIYIWYASMLETWDLQHRARNLVLLIIFVAQHFD